MRRDQGMDVGSRNTSRFLHREHGVEDWSNRGCGFRYNARGIARRYFCNECRRKFSVPYVEPHAAPGLPSGTLWLLTQVAMLTSKLNELLSDLEERTMSAEKTSQCGGQVP